MSPLVSFSYQLSAISYSENKTAPTEKKSSPIENFRRRREIIGGDEKKTRAIRKRSPPTEKKLRRSEKITDDERKIAATKENHGSFAIRAVFWKMHEFYLEIRAVSDQKI